MEEIKEPVPTPDMVERAKQGREFLASERAEYNRFTLDIVAQYPVSIGSIISFLGYCLGRHTKKCHGGKNQSETQVSQVRNRQ